MIDIKSILNMALVSLKVNKMRSALTSLGVIIGVSAVIVMLAVGTGSSQKIASDMESMGVNLFMIRPSASTSGGVKSASGSMPTLTLKDSEAIESKISGVLSVAPFAQESSQITYANQNWSTSVMGINPQYLFVRNYEVASGRNIKDEDVLNCSKVVIIGHTVALELFGDLDPIDRVIRINNVPHKVIGLLKEKGESSMGSDQDDILMIPITTHQQRVFGTNFPGTVKAVFVKAVDESVMTKMENDISELLRTRHKIGAKQEDDFEVRNMVEMQETIKSTANTMAALLSAIAGISLIVGGIGIMNIMLVSVTERTKEIGIRMAIGAKSSDIRIQFLIESFILSMAGGIMGVAIGFLGSFLIQHLSGTPTVITPASVVMSLGFSGAIGIIFGYYPAYKASLLAPIDALRYE